MDSNMTKTVQSRQDQTGIKLYLTQRRIPAVQPQASSGTALRYAFKNACALPISRNCSQCERKPISEAASAVFGSLLQGIVHAFESLLSFCSHATPQQRNEETGEFLILSKPHQLRTNRLQSERMLTVEYAWHQQRSAPAQFLLRLGYEHFGLECHARRRRLPNGNHELQAYGGHPGGSDDERIPLGIGCEICQHLPDPL